MSVEHFFNRNDDKPFFLEQINKLDDPKWGMESFRAILETAERDSEILLLFVDEEYHRKPGNPNAEIVAQVPLMTVGMITVGIPVPNSRGA